MPLNQKKVRAATIFLVFYSNSVPPPFTMITKPLTAIINQSILNGIFPDKLKLAKVIPIYKKGDVNDLNNYRPISLLPTLSKIFERVVHSHTQLFHYFTKKTIFFNHNNCHTTIKTIYLESGMNFHLDGNQDVRLIQIHLSVILSHFKLTFIF